MKKGARVETCEFECIASFIIKVTYTGIKDKRNRNTCESVRLLNTVNWSNLGQLLFAECNIVVFRIIVRDSFATAL